MHALINPPPSAKPWSEQTVKNLLGQMIHDHRGILTAREIETAEYTLELFKRREGLDFQRGKYRVEGSNLSFEVGLGWESSFFVEAPGTGFSTVNRARIFAGGNLSSFSSWNITAFGGFQYAEGDLVPAGDFLAELNGSFFDDRLHLRLGRIRRDWGGHSAGTSLFMNAYAPPFLAFEGIYSPFFWMNVSFLTGILERSREDSGNGLFTNSFSLARLEMKAASFFRFGVGASVISGGQPNAAFFTDVEFRFPGLFRVWGSLFVDRINSPAEEFFFNNFFMMKGNSYAYQAGIEAVIRWLPFSTFIMRYTKVEPYCFAASAIGGAVTSAYVNRGVSLGHYLSPNNDELLFRFQSRLSPSLRTFVQFQRIRGGVDFGYGAISGSSLRDILTNPHSEKYFLMDGVYQWDRIFKTGAEIFFQRSVIPWSLFMEAGMVSTRFTINGSAGVGVEADFEPLDDAVYRAGNRFIFSIGFRLFP